jgi:hypothetical protein
MRPALHSATTTVSLVQLAVESDVTWITAWRWAHGLSMKPRTRRRVDAAAERLGVRPLVSKE